MSYIYPGDKNDSVLFNPKASFMRSNWVRMGQVLRSIKRSIDCQVIHIVINV
jgi:hypothetical protein